MARSCASADDREPPEPRVIGQVGGGSATLTSAMTLNLCHS